MANGRLVEWPRRSASHPGRPHTAHTAALCAGRRFMSHPLSTLPEVQVEEEGVSLAAEDLYALVGIRVQQRLSLPALCELTFSDPPGPLAAAARLEPGTTLRGMGAGQQEPLFAGRVTAVEHCYEPAHGPEIRVRGY